MERVDYIALVDALNVLSVSCHKLNLTNFQL